MLSSSVLARLHGQLWLQQHWRLQPRYTGQPSQPGTVTYSGLAGDPHQEPQTQSCQTEAGCYWSTQHNRDILFSSFSLRTKVLQGEYDLSSQYSSLHPSSDKTKNHQYQKRNSTTQLKSANKDKKYQVERFIS